MRLVLPWLLVAALAASIGCGRAGPPVRRAPEAAPAEATQPAEEPEEEEQP